MLCPQHFYDEIIALPVDLRLRRSQRAKKSSAIVMDLHVAGCMVSVSNMFFSYLDVW